MIARLILGIVGLGIITFALLPDYPAGVGLGRGGFAQILLTLCGAGMIVFVIFASRIRPKRLVKGYEQVAVLLLNTILFFIAIELLVIVSFNLQFITTGSQEAPSGEELALYTEEDLTWREQYRMEYREFEANIQYSPYDLWTHPRFEGEAINILADGARYTPDAQCDDADTYRVHLYGGSTMWGFGVMDTMTIAAYLQAELNAANLDRPVCIVNYGELAMVNTQEMIRLVKQLQQGNVPDLVIFYDGVNDVIATHQRSTPGSHRLYGNFVLAVNPEGVSHPLASWLRNSYTVRFIRALLPTPEDEPEEATDDVQTVEIPLAEQAANAYLENYRIVNTLGADYGFDVLFFWQPMMIVSDKPLTEQEQVMAQAPPDNLAALFADTYAIIEAAAPDYAQLHDLSDIFDDVEQMLFFDYNHVSYAGNERIAQAMRDIVIETINNTE
jgi:lysophospholipase L1-like esterase